MWQGMDASWTGKRAGLGHDGVTLFHAPGRVGVGCCVQGVALKGFWLSVIARERPGLQKATPQKRAHFWRSSLQSRRLPSAIVPSALAQAPSSGSQSISGLKSADRGHNKGVDQKRYRSVSACSRQMPCLGAPGCTQPSAEGTPNTRKPRLGLGSLNGAKRIRTADPLHAMQVLYQLSYGPIGALGGPNPGDPVELGSPGLSLRKLTPQRVQPLRPGATPPQACPGR